jgi:tetratricopeptide (TPR) repeat protein
MLEQEGRGNEAADEYRAAANEWPGSAEYQYMAGHALFFYQGKVKEGTAHLESAVRLAPDYYEAHRDLGWAFFQTGDLDGAVRQYQEALRINPKSAEAHDYLGRVLLSRDDVDGAVAEFHAALAIDANYGNAHYFLGEALGQQGRAVEGAAERAEAQRLWQEQSERR